MKYAGYRKKIATVRLGTKSATGLNLRNGAGPTGMKGMPAAVASITLITMKHSELPLPLETLALLGLTAREEASPICSRW